MESIVRTTFFVCFYLSALCISFIPPANHVLAAHTANLRPTDETEPSSKPHTVKLPTVAATMVPQLPSLAVTHEEIIQQDIYPKDCYSNGENLCIQAPAAAVRDYLRTLGARLFAVSKSDLNFEDPKLMKRLNELGCLSIAIIDLREVQATVGLFRQGLVSRLRLDKNLLHEFGDKCGDRLTPIAFHQHEFSIDVEPRGQLNKNDSCGVEKTGGHHDPGYACGPLGGRACKNMSIPASSALEGTSLFDGNYQCTPPIYRKRPFACHAGDFTGKLGIGRNVSPDSSRPDYRLMANDVHADNPCVAPQDNNSLVVHCHFTNYRLACAPFQRIETAGKRLPGLLSEMIKTARNSVPYARDQTSLLASLFLVQEVEARIEVLESALRKSKPEDDVELDSNKREMPDTKRP